MNRKVNKLTFPQLTSLAPRISSSVPWKINNAMFKESTGFGNNVNNFDIWSASWNLTHRRHLSCSSLIRRILSWSSFSFLILSSRSPSSSIFSPQLDQRTCWLEGVDQTCWLEVAGTTGSKVKILCRESTNLNSSVEGVNFKNNFLGD